MLAGSFFIMQFCILWFLTRDMTFHAVHYCPLVSDFTTTGFYVPFCTVVFAHISTNTQSKPDLPLTTTLIAIYHLLDMTVRVA